MRRYALYSGMNIIDKLAKQCDRQDCAFAYDRSGFANSAGFFAWVTCQTCGRKWTIHQPDRRDPAIYDRTGKLLNPEPLAEITEVNLSNQ